MRIAIITAAGVSGRFNEGYSEADCALKMIYSEGDEHETLLYHLLEKCDFADRIIIVGGYRYEELQAYIASPVIPDEWRERIRLIFNKHYEDLNSGYSLYKGLEKAFSYNPDEIVFVEGDVDTDPASFEAVVESDATVLTYCREPIYSEKAVVFYQRDDGEYHYAFNADHGMLKIEEPFWCILNSAQMWKFRDMDALAAANDDFRENYYDETNLLIVQGYLDRLPEEERIVLRELRNWTNCNTRKDWRRIRQAWAEDEGGPVLSCIDETEHYSKHSGDADSDGVIDI
ncbi:MAG: hypothetical protein J5819_09970 [Eubacterium sp.]|nr:hypothetical protein [Eubacterium sp.]